MYEKLIIAREHSWLSFNARVLQEANDPSVPLKERIRFLGIFSNNRDEFFRIRMAALKKLLQYPPKNRQNFFKNPQKVLRDIHRIILQQQDVFNRIWKKILGDLKNEKVFLLDDKHLNAKQKAFVRNFFDEEVSSSIIPLFIEDMLQLPSFGDDSIFLGIVMKKTAKPYDQKFAIIEIPTRNHSRFVSLPAAPGEQNLILLEHIIHFNISRIFAHLGYTHFDAHMFKVTKDAEIGIDHDVSSTFIQQIEKGVKNRRKGHPVNFLYDKRMNQELAKFLIHKFELSPFDSVIPGGSIRNFRDFMDFPATLPKDHERPHPFKHPLLAKAMRVYDVLHKQDVLLNPPYHSFNSIIDLLCEAAMDPDVKSIKITAYRLAANSKICNALINAARSGKKVYVVLELRASFNERANLEWKSRLEEEGVKVFLGIPDKKVHAKLCVIKKQVGNKFEYYGFVGTGNINEVTALRYTDLFLLTSNRAIMADVNRFFKILESPETLPKHPSFKTLLVSPWNMRQALSSLIDREIKEAKAGKPSKIIANINSLSDEKIISKLHEAASAGVPVHLIVRSIFCAEPEQKNFAHTITAISIVDEYLEHSRIWFFHHAGQEKMYIASSDWTERNLNHRVEVAVQITDEAIKNDLKNILNIKLLDNVKARKLDSQFSNQYVSSKGKKKVRSQIAIYRYLRNKR